MFFLFLFCALTKELSTVLCWWWWRIKTPDIAFFFACVKVWECVLSEWVLIPPAVCVVPVAVEYDDTRTSALSPDVAAIRHTNRVCWCVWSGRLFIDTQPHKCCVLMVSGKRYTLVTNLASLSLSLFFVFLFLPKHTQRRRRRNKCGRRLIYFSYC